MIFPALERSAYAVYPATLIDRVCSHRLRNLLRTTLLWVLLGLLVVIALQLFIDIAFISDHIFQFRGAFLLLFSVWLGLFLIETMYFSFYFREGLSVDFALASIVLKTVPHDVTGSFLVSRLGQYAMLRLGISAKELEAFLKTRTEFVSTDEYMIVPDERSNFITVAEYGRALIHFDNQLKKFLAQHGVTPDMFRYALRWVAKNQTQAREHERWWSRDNLARIPSLGKNFSFGQVYLLEKFGHIIFAEDEYIHLGDKWRLQKDNVLRLEQILVKETGANIMLVCEDDSVGMEVVSSLAKQIVQGTALPELKAKRVYVLDGTSIIDTMQKKTEFESMINQIFFEAAKAGNVIIVIPRLPQFVESALTIGVDLENLLSEALSSNSLQIIALSDTQGFHSTVESNHGLMRRFDKVMISGFDEFQTVSVLEDESMYIEAQHPIFFSYQSLVAIAECAHRYFADGSIRDKAVALLHEIVPKLATEKRVLVSREDVLALVEQKTGIPQGAVGGEERDKLNNLESILHERIVGQESAVKSIADALKRARAGLANPKRPMGSFLFLGPTGVGKTETTKALAETYFGNEESIIRIDMSEYTSYDALEKLIGSSQTEKPGILSSLVREKQYGVLLLDEFEKTSKEVMDLFLQVLDEGYFSDGRGEKVNARNLIIIATSNAGSDLIYQATQKGLDVSKKKNEIVNALIVEGIFKPELVNRFDEVIVFHPLSEGHLEKVAEMMIDRLNKRLEKQSITILPGGDLVKYLVSQAHNPQFGAREMNRVVQDSIEKLIAESIIDGTVQTGDTVSISENNGTLSVTKQ